MPLTRKGKRILAAMRKKYGEKAESIFYASANKGTITGVHKKKADSMDIRRKKKTVQRDPQGREVATYEEEDDDNEFTRSQSSGGGTTLYTGVGGSGDLPRKKKRPEPGNGSEPQGSGLDSLPLFSIVSDYEPLSIRATVHDSVALDDAAKIKYTEDGYMTAMPRIARIGIQLYKGDECGRPDMDRVRVYRPIDSVFARDAINSYTHLPVTLEHPGAMVTPDNWKDHAVGETGDEILRDGGTVRVPMMLRDAAAIQAFKDGKNQLSVGYTCDLKWKSGVTEDGEYYDAIQTNIRANHLAVVAAARGGPSLTIGDDTKKGVHMNLKSVMVDGIQCEMTDTAAALVQKTIQQLNDKYNSLLEDFNGFKKKKKEEEEEMEEEDSAIKKSLDAKDGEIAALKKQLEDSKITEDEIDRRAAAKQLVVDKARSLMPKVAVDGQSISAIRRQVVADHLKLDVKEWSDDKVAGAFDAIAVTAKPCTQSGPGISDAARVFSRPHLSMADAEAIKAKAYADAEAADAERWRTGGMIGKTS